MGTVPFGAKAGLAAPPLALFHRLRLLAGSGERQAPGAAARGRSSVAG